MHLISLLLLVFLFPVGGQQVFSPQWFDTADVRGSTRTWRYAFHPKWWDESLVATHWADENMSGDGIRPTPASLTKDLHRAPLQKLAKMLMYVKIEEADNYLDADVLLINKCDFKGGPHPNADETDKDIIYPEGTCFTQCGDCDGCAGYGFYGDANEKCPIFSNDALDQQKNYTAAAELPPGRVGYVHPYTIPWESGARWRGRIQLSGSYMPVNGTILTDGHWSCQFGPGKSILHEFFHSLGWKHQFTREDTHLFLKDESTQLIEPLGEPTIPWTFVSIMQYSFAPGGTGITNDPLLKQFCDAKAAPCGGGTDFQRTMLTGQTYDSEKTWCTPSLKKAVLQAKNTDTLVCGMGYDGDTLSHLDRAAMERWWGAKGCTQQSDCAELGYVCSIVPRDMIPDAYIKAKEPQYEFPNYGFCRPENAADFCQFMPGVSAESVCPTGKTCACKLGHGSSPSPCAGLCEAIGQSDGPEALVQRIKKLRGGGKGHAGGGHLGPEGDGDDHDGVVHLQTITESNVDEHAGEMDEL